ncbi:MAG: hypothetical protein ABL891_10650 [Burkholderiales bacterium]
MNASRGNALRTALDHLGKGNWSAAHNIVQSDESPEGCWVHAIVHVMEGDPDNARYWYGRAARVFSADTAAEVAAARKSLS